MDHFEFLIETMVFVLSRPIIHQLDDQLLYAMSIFSVALRQDSQLRFSSIPIDPNRKIYLISMQHDNISTCVEFASIRQVSKFSYIIICQSPMIASHSRLKIHET